MIRQVKNISFFSKHLLVEENDYCFYKIKEHRFRFQASYHFSNEENTLDHITLRRSIFTEIMDKNI